METVKIKTSELQNGIDYIIDNRLIFEDGRLYVTRTPYKNNKQSDFEEKVDVTEDVLDMLEKLQAKRRTAARQAAITRQLSNQ